MTGIVDARRHFRLASKRPSCSKKFNGQHSERIAARRKTTASRFFFLAGVLKRADRVAAAGARDKRRISLSMVIFDQRVDGGFSGAAPKPPGLLNSSRVNGKPAARAGTGALWSATFGAAVIPRAGISRRQFIFFAASTSSSGFAQNPLTLAVVNPCGTFSKIGGAGQFYSRRDIEAHRGPRPRANSSRGDPQLLKTNVFFP